MGLATLSKQAHLLPRGDDPKTCICVHVATTLRHVYVSTCYFKYIQSYAVLINFKYPCGSGPVPALMDLKYIHLFRCSTFEIDLK